MAEEKNTQAEQTVEVQTQAAQAANGAAERTFTQDDVNRIVAERLARAKQQVPDDYEELKAKAAKFDKAEEDKKTELQKAMEKSAALEKELNDMKAAEKRRAEVAKAAKEHGVDAELLGRMAGDVAENAEFLKSIKDSAQKFPTIPDSGAVPKQEAPRELPKII